MNKDRKFFKEFLYYNSIPFNYSEGVYTIEAEHKDKLFPYVYYLCKNYIYFYDNSAFLFIFPLSRYGQNKDVNIYNIPFGGALSINERLEYFHFPSVYIIDLRYLKNKNDILLTLLPKYKIYFKFHTLLQVKGKCYGISIDGNGRFYIAENFIFLTKDGDKEND